MQAIKKIIAFALVNILLAGTLQFFLRQYPFYESKAKDYIEGDYNSVVIGSSFGQNLALEDLPEGEKAYDFCFPGMNFMDYSYILRELHNHADLDRVYLDLSLEYWTGEAGAYNAVNMPQMLSGRNELDYFFHIFGKQNFTSCLFPYKLTGYNVSCIPRTVRRKLTAITGVQKQAPAVTFAKEEQEVDRNLNPMFFSPENISQETQEMFEVLAGFCRDNDIELIVFATAFPRERLLAENVGEVHDYFADYFRELGVTFYDMNYVRWDLLPRVTEEYSDLHGHMRYALKRKQTKLLAEIMGSQEPEAYFVEDYAQVLEGLDKMEDLLS